MAHRPAVGPHCRRLDDGRPGQAVRRGRKTIRRDLQQAGFPVESTEDPHGLKRWSISSVEIPPITHPRAFLIPGRLASSLRTAQSAH